MFGKTRKSLLLMAVAMAAGWGLAAAAAEKHLGIDPAGIDRSVKPGDEFYLYANGAWIKQAKIPEDRSSFGPGVKLVEQANQRTRDLIQETAKAGAPAGSEAAKIADYYASFLDEAAVEAKGRAPLQPDLDRIAAIRDKTELARALGETLRADTDPLNNTNYHTPHLFGVWVAQDFNDPTRNTAYVLQGGIGLPDRDYYLSDDAKMAETRTQYKAHVTKVLTLAGIADPAAAADRVIALETKIARAHLDAVASRDVVKADNPWSLADFAAKAPGLDWKAYFAAAGVTIDHFIAWQPSAITGEAALVASEPLEDWKAFLAFHAADEASPYLSKAFADENFDFYDHILSGVPQQRERWKRAIDATNGALGFAVGHLYVQRYFPPEAKAKIEAIVQKLMVAFDRRIDKLAWMAPATKAEAKAKLKALKVGVGYPDHWRDYSSLQVVKGDAYGNWRRADQFEYRRNLAKLTTPVDRGEWWMTPQTVNAVNLPVQNALNFPAAILQPPYFDPDAPAVANYGAIGAIIGHEISHSFDTEGAQFDSTGRLRNWWTPADFEHFSASAARLATQFDQYHPFPDLAVNGKLTLTENIADVAGLSAAYDAWKMSLNGKPAPSVAGFTGDQQFFLAFDQSWREVRRDASLRRAVLTNEHAPAHYRGLTVRNLDAWYPAFKVEPGQALYLTPDQRTPVW
jgi:putative endopeptidase